MRYKQIIDEYLQPIRTHSGDICYIYLMIFINIGVFCRFITELFSCVADNVIDVYMHVTVDKQIG